MGNDPELETQQAGKQQDAAPPIHHDAEHQGDTTQFSDQGAKPAVATGGGTARASASERGYKSATKKAAKPKAPTAADWSEAETALQIAADIVQNQRSKMIAGAPARYATALTQLYGAVTGRDHGKSVNGAQRHEWFTAAKAGLQPAIALYQGTEEGKQWLDQQLLRQLDWAYSSITFTEAKDRVDNSVLIGSNKVVEMPDEKHPHEQGMLLHAQLTKLVPKMMMINEQVIRMGHDSIHHQAAEMMKEGKLHGGKSFGPGLLVELMNVLMLADAFLLLTDEEFQHHLNNVHGVFGGIRTYAEFVKAVTELAGGCIGVTASYAAVLAKLTGDSALATVASGLARSSGLVFANVIAGIEIIYGVATLLDPNATKQEKLDGAVHASSGAAWFIGSRVGGAAVGFAASTAILLTYAELKLMAHLYWEANIGITTGFMRLAYETIQRDGESIAQDADALAKCGLLIQEEKDPEKLASLQRVEKVLAERLGGSVDYFIDDCAPRGYEAGVAKYPGAYTIFRELFGPLKQYKGAKTPEAATKAATATLQKITWSYAHAGELILASAKQQHLSDVEADIAKKEAAAGSGENKH